MTPETFNLIFLALALGAGGALLYWRAEAVRSFVSVLTPAPVVFLVIFLVVAPADDIEPGALVATLAVYLLAAAWGDRRKVRDAYAEQLELRAAEKERERIEAAERRTSFPRGPSKNVCAMSATPTT